MRRYKLTPKGEVFVEELKESIIDWAIRAIIMTAKVVFGLAIMIGLFILVCIRYDAKVERSIQQNITNPACWWTDNQGVEHFTCGY